mmetsp:Transcript_32600/g.98051  ORF Transcript_32600/g.98051 Transcript_32600/m.98051 type:complete len:287 (-) Transcript_32600:1177-2037(-)
MRRAKRGQGISPHLHRPVVHGRKLLRRHGTNRSADEGVLVRRALRLRRRRTLPDQRLVRLPVGFLRLREGRGLQCDPEHRLRGDQPGGLEGIPCPIQAQRRGCEIQDCARLHQDALHEFLAGADVSQDAAAPACPKAWFELAAWTDAFGDDDETSKDAARHAYARCLGVGGDPPRGRLAAVAGARLVIDAGDEEKPGATALADFTPAAAWAPVAPQLLAACFEKTPAGASAAASPDVSIASSSTALICTPGTGSTSWSTPKSCVLMCSKYSAELRFSMLDTGMCKR